ncbi:hypothetical protein KKB99_04910, partial [bacterium]|nr:hypothetical protein [bacterium]MBU1025337.1 hypothetical protein [bacterium]
TFLKTAKVGTFIWAVSVINFLTLAVLLLVLFLHHLMDKLFVIKAIVASLLVLFLVSAVQLVTRRRLFRTLELQLRDQRAEVIREMQDMIDEKKREKIREKYKKNGD